MSEAMGEFERARPTKVSHSSKDPPHAHGHTRPVDCL